MTEWLAETSQWHEMYCHNVEVMSSNPGRVELEVHSTSVLSCTLTNYISTVAMPVPIVVKFTSSVQNFVKAIP